MNKEKSDQVDPENWDVKKIKWINNIGPTYIYIYKMYPTIAREIAAIYYFIFKVNASKTCKFRQVF